MLTKLIVIGVIVGLIVYDVVALKIGQPTESMILRNWGLDWTLLPFIAGFLLAHWFAPVKQYNQSAWMYALPIFALLLSVDLFMYFKHSGYYPVWRYPLWYALAGIPTGILLWPQTSEWSPF